MEHYLLLILIMVGFGILGGIVNYFYNDTKSSRKVFKVVDYDLLKSLFTGIVASLLVPLFLNMLSSNIMQESREDSLKLLIFCGFCLIAAVSSRAFIQTLSSKILHRINKVEEDVTAVKDDIQPVILNQTEIDQPESDQKGSDRARTLTPATPVLSESLSKTESDKLKILNSLVSSKYTFRTINGLNKDTGIDMQNARTILKDSVEKGLVKQVTKDADTKFYITEIGRNHLVKSSEMQDET